MQKEIKKALIKNKLAVTSKDIIHSALIEYVSDLYKDDGSFSNNRFQSERVFNPISQEDIKEIVDNVWDYITDNK